MFDKSDEQFMRLAIEQAQRALESNDRPVGAVIVHRNEVIGASANAIKSERSKIAHAELRAIQECASYLFVNAEECIIYTTHEPCIMCLGAIAVSNMRRVFYGLPDPESPGREAIGRISYLRDCIDVYEGGLLESECRRLWERARLLGIIETRKEP